MNKKITITAQISDWLVTKTNLSGLVSLFNKRYPKPLGNVSIEINYGSEDEETETVHTFGELDKYITKEIINGNNILNMIRIQGYNSKLSGPERYGWIEINFHFNSARWCVIVDGTNTNKDWAAGFKRDIIKLFNSFKPEIDVIEYIKQKKPEKYKYKSSVIEFDYKSKISEDMKKNATILPQININDSQIHFGGGDNNKAERISDFEAENKESIWVKLFWSVIIAIIVGVVVSTFSHWLGLN